MAAWVERLADDFNRANENPVAAPWTYVEGSGTLQVFNNKLCEISNKTAGYKYVSALAFADNQYQEEHATDNYDSGGLPYSFRMTVRSTAPTPLGYALEVTSTGSAGKLILLTGSTVGGPGTLLASGTLSAAAAVFRIEAEGTTLRALRDGVQVLSAVHASVSSGKPLWQYAYRARLDNWAAGDSGGGASLSRCAGIFRPIRTLYDWPRVGG